MKEASLERNTQETRIKMALAIPALPGRFEGTSGIGFFDHMLNSFCVHGGFSLSLTMSGDLHVDGHHTVEDCGIVLGSLFAQILGDRSRIARFGQAYVPMDESLALAVIDCCGRPFLRFNASFQSERIGDYDTQLTAEFFRALAFHMGATLHLSLTYGENDHHKTEALFKAAARALLQSLRETDGGILSAKGTLA